MTRDVIQISGQGKLGSRYKTSYAWVPGGYINKVVKFLRDFSVFKKRKRNIKMLISCF